MWGRLQTVAKENPIITLLLLAVALQIVMFALGLFVLNPRAAHNQQGIEAISEQTAKASLTSCQRGNVTRPQTIQTDLDIAQGNRDRAAAWLAIAKAFPPTAEVAMQQHDANIGEATRLHHDAAVIANAQRPVAKFPKAKSLTKRSIVDCHEQFGT